MTRVAVAPEVEAEERVPPEGTLVSVQGGVVSVEGSRDSEKVARTRSTLPFASTSRMSSVPATSTGRAASAGVLAANEERLPAASRMPVAEVASATLKEPTAVSGAPAPSAIVRVAVVPDTDTEERVPPEGTLESVQGAVPAE